MNQEELRRTVQHAAQLHGVSTREVVEAVLDADKRPDSPRVRWTAGIMATLVVGGMVGGVIWGLAKLVNGPATAAAIPKLHMAPAVAPAAEAMAGTSRLEGLNISFAYSGAFNQVARINTDARGLEQYMLGSKANYKHQIAVEVSSLPSGKLDDDSSYKLRLVRYQDYQQTFTKITGEPVAIMTKNDGREQTMFWAHGTKLLTIAITSSDPHDDVQAFMRVISGSVRWRA